MIGDQVEDVTEENKKPSSFPSHLPAELGEVIGGYKRQKVLGRDGMGTVFEGKHSTLGRAGAYIGLWQR